MQIKFISSILIGGVAVAAAHRPSSRRAFLSKTTMMNNALSIRGGAGLPVEATAKSVVAITGLQGLVNWLAPETSLAAYEMDISEEEQGIAEHFLNLDGADLLAPSIAMHAILSHNVEPMKALGMGCLVAVITNFKNIINGSSEKLKLGKGGQVFSLTLTSFLTHALLTGADYATTATKVLSAFWALVGLQCRLDPEVSVVCMMLICPIFVHMICPFCSCTHLYSLVERLLGRRGDVRVVRIRSSSLLRLWGKI